MAFSLRTVMFASTTLALLTSCGGQDTADALIGPEGGVVAHDDGVTLTVPPGALLVTRQIIIRPSDEKLTRGNFEQVGEAYLIEPRDLEFRVPAQLTFDTSVKEKPTVLLMPGDKRVIAYSAADDKPTAYIGTLGIVAAAKGGDADAKIDAPTLARAPAEVNLKTPAIDTPEVKPNDSANFTKSGLCKSEAMTRLPYKFFCICCTLPYWLLLKTMVMRPM